MKTTINIATNPNLNQGQKNETVDAYTTNSPNLFVHKSPNDTGWTISHIPSGYRIFWAKTRTLAIDAANLLAKLPGWDILTPNNCGELYSQHGDFLRDVRDYAHGTAPRPV